MDKPKTNDSTKKAPPTREAKLKNASPAATRTKKLQNDTVTLKKPPVGIGRGTKRDNAVARKQPTGRRGHGKFDDMHTAEIPGDHIFLLKELNGENVILVQRIAGSPARGYRAKVSTEIPTATGQIQIIEDGRLMSGNEEFSLYTDESNYIKVGYVNADRFIPLKKANALGGNRWTFFNDDDREPRIIIEMSDNNISSRP